MFLFLNLNQPTVMQFVVYIVAALFVLVITPILLGMRYIPNHCVGVMEKLWSPYGPIGEGRLIVVDREAGYQAAVLRGGIYFCYWLWQYRIHKVPLTMVPERLFVAGADGADGHAPPAAQGLLGTLISLLVAQRAGFRGDGSPGDKAPAGRAEESLLKPCAG